MIRKIIRIAILLVLLVFICTACSFNFSTSNKVENSNSSTVSMSHTDFNDTISKSILVAQGETCEVTFDVTSKSGSLDLSLTGQDGSQSYTGSSIPTSHFTVTLDKPQTYTLTIQGSHHSGSYKISWTTK